MKIKDWFYQFLRRTQKYTGTDNVYLVKSGAWLTLPSMVMTIIALVMGMAWARFVPKEVYGQYNYILSLAGLLAIFSLDNPLMNANNFQDNLLKSSSGEKWQKKLI